MQSGEFLGLPWWQWLLLVMVCWTIAVLVRRGSSKAREREAQEALARQADAAHEGARTRHEGGA